MTARGALNTLEQFSFKNYSCHILVSFIMK